MVIAPVRWRAGESRVTREFPPLAADHPAHAEPCAVCPHQLGNGEPVRGVVVGPGEDADDQQACAEGKWFSALAVLAHARCAGKPVDAAEQPRYRCGHPGCIGHSDQNIACV